MNVLNIASILLNNNVKSIRWPFFHYSKFLYDVIIRSNEKNPTEKEVLWSHSNNDRFYIKVSIYVTDLSARFFLLLLLMFHFEWTNRWIRKCCCQFFCRCCWFRARFDTEWNEWNWFLAKCFQEMENTQRTELVIVSISFFSTFCFVFWGRISATLHNNSNNRKPIYGSHYETRWKKANQVRFSFILNTRLCLKCLLVFFASIRFSTTSTKNIMVKWHNNFNAKTLYFDNNNNNNDERQKKIIFFHELFSYEFYSAFMHTVWYIYMKLCQLRQRNDGWNARLASLRCSTWDTMFCVQNYDWMH